MRHRSADLPPGPSAPALVQTARWVRDPVAFFDGCRDRYGTRFTVRFAFGPPIVSLSDPEAIRAVFSAPPDVLEPGAGGGVLEPIVGARSVLLLDGEEHLRQRRLMLPAFHGERMTGLEATVTDVTERAIAAWPRGRAFELHPQLQALTLEVILRAVFGLAPGPRLDELRAVLTEYLEVGTNPLVMAPQLHRDLGPRSPWGRFVRVRARALGLVEAEIARRRAGADEDHGDVLAMLLGATEEDGTPMADGDIRDELVTLLVAGHETTASQLAWTCERLVRTPAVLARLQAAVDAGDDAYLTATIQEALRTRPVLMFAQPRYVRRAITVDGFDYPAGSCALAANVHLVHHDPAIYPDPHAFRPERFLEKAPGTFTWLPFGGGRRRCLGLAFAMLEMRVVLAALLRAAELSGDPGAPAPERHLRRHITVSPARGARVVLRARTRPATPLQAA